MVAELSPTWTLSHWSPIFQVDKTRIDLTVPRIETTNRSAKSIAQVD